MCCSPSNHRTTLQHLFHAFLWQPQNIPHQVSAFPVPDKRVNAVLCVDLLKVPTHVNSCFVPPLMWHRCAFDKHSMCTAVWFWCLIRELWSWNRETSCVFRYHVLFCLLGNGVCNPVRDLNETILGVNCYITLLLVCIQTPGMLLTFLSLAERSACGKSNSIQMLVLWILGFSRPAVPFVSLCLDTHLFELLIPSMWHLSGAGVSLLMLLCGLLADMFNRFTSCLSSGLRWMVLAFSPPLIRCL